MNENNSKIKNIQDEFKKEINSRLSNNYSSLTNEEIKNIKAIGYDST